MFTILILEDDRELNQTMAYALEKEGYRVLCAHSCREADALAEDYVTKPFSMKILLKKVYVILSRKSPGADIYDDGFLKVDFERGTVKKGAQECPLTPTEYRILKKLIENKGKLLTYGVLMDSLWDEGVQITDKHTLAAVVGLACWKYFQLKRDVYAYTQKLDAAVNRMLKEERLETVPGEKDHLKVLVSDFSHQAKTPMANIRLYLEMMEEETEPDRAGNI